MAWLPQSKTCQGYQIAFGNTIVMINDVNELWNKKQWTTAFSINDQQSVNGWQHTHRDFKVIWACCGGNLRKKQALNFVQWLCVLFQFFPSVH